MIIPVIDEDMTINIVLLYDDSGLHRRKAGNFNFRRALLKQLWKLIINGLKSEEEGKTK